MITWSIGKKCIKFLKTILDGRDAILRVRVKWLIFNIVLQLWADVKYHVPTGFFAEDELFFYVFVLVPQYFSTEPFFVLVAAKMEKMMQTTMKASVVMMMPMAERLAIARNTR